MKVVVTCGPSCAPIDEVRRITNFSTGELGILLGNELVRAGFEVLCFKGSGATHPGPGEQCHLSRFNTNDDLLDLFDPQRPPVVRQTPDFPLPELALPAQFAA